MAVESDVLSLELDDGMSTYYRHACCYNNDDSDNDGDGDSDDDDDHNDDDHNDVDDDFMTLHPT